MTHWFFLFKFVYIYIAYRFESQTEIKMSFNPFSKKKKKFIEEKYEIILEKQKWMSIKKIAEKYGHSASMISGILYFILY